MNIISFDIGIKNMAYCYATVENKSLNIIELNKIDLNINKSNIQGIIDNTLEFLDDLLTRIDINNDKKLVVLIEVQMTSIMRTIQTVINTYFKMIAKFENIDIETKYLSAKHKLNLISKYNILELNIDVKSNKYKQNKEDSIKFTKWLLENQYKNNEILNIYNTTKKKDDISDSFLMIIYYYENNVF